MIVNKRMGLFTKYSIFIVISFLFIYTLTSAGPSIVTRSLQQSGRNLSGISQAQIQPLTQGAPSPGNSPKAGTIVKKTSGEVSDMAKAQKIEMTTWDKVMHRLRDGLNCVDKLRRSTRQQRGDYWVLYNYIQPEISYKCHESVTYTTHADYCYLDNLVPLLERWNGPISIALHAPGTDFKHTMKSIHYLRDCTTPLVKKFVTFHVYFSTKHIPSEIPLPEIAFKEPYNCSQKAPFSNITTNQTYKSQNKLLYPVNVGRNVARESAQTHFMLASDIELYPSPNIIPQFLEMIARNEQLQTNSPRVFPLHLFEVAANQQIPKSKTQLQGMLKRGTAVPFHEKMCSLCHNIPKSKEWREAKEVTGFHVFHVGQRTGKWAFWEPIFIGTHADPLYDERLSWEGKSDKMTHAYALCAMNYEFMILDNAFLVHSPGIKSYKIDSKRLLLSSKTNELISKVISRELKIIYGERKGCMVSDVVL